MKIKLKFSKDQIVAISILLNKLYELNFPALTHQEKVDVSIGCILSDFFEKKKRTLLKKIDLLNVKDKVSVTLNYYEVYALKNIFIEQIYLLDNDFQKFNIQQAINLLDPKTPTKNDKKN